MGARPDAPASGLPSADGNPAPAPRQFVPIEPHELAVTSGEVVPEEAGRFSIRSPTFRAELGRAPRSAIEVSFVYRGPTQELARLASGEPRRQIGLKLRAHDTCNVVYAMWHIEPSPGIVVSVKSNPGLSRHADCGDRGYSFLQPTSSQVPPHVAPDQPHVLRAEIRGRTLRVKTDGETCWEGELPAAAFEFDGPVGLRSDNGQFSVALRAEELVP